MKKINFHLNSVLAKAAALLLFGSLSGNSQAQCVASFSYTVAANGLVQFQNTSTNPTSLTVCSWNFGDGQYAYNASGNVNHNYSSGGIFVVTLHLNDSSACSSSVSQTINVNTMPCTAPVSFVTYKDSIQPLNWHIWPTYPGNMASVTWFWGDGTSSPGMYPSHTYSAAGTYSICVAVTANCGTTNTVCINTSIYRSSSAAISVDVVGSSAPTGIKGNSAGQVEASLYPNPVATNAVLNLYSTTEATYKLSIYTVDGKLISTDQVKAQPGQNTAELNTETLQSGLYFISLSNGAARKTIRLVKE